MDELFSQVDEKRKVSMKLFHHVIAIVSSLIQSLLSSSQRASGIHFILFIKAKNWQAAQHGRALIADLATGERVNSA